MTTAIAVYSSDGCEGRCDARCHNASTPACECICNGRLHGVGATNAITQNTRDMLGDDMAELLQQYAKTHNLDAGALRVEHRQATLL